MFFVVSQTDPFFSQLSSDSVFFDGETCLSAFFHTFEFFDTMHAIDMITLMVLPLEIDI